MASDKKKTDLTRPLSWLIGMYAVSLLGLKFHETQDIFIRLIPLNLVVTLGVLLYYQKHWNVRIILYLFFVFWASFFIEVIGVKTGKVFGSYFYGRALGPRLLEVPIVMGVTWLVFVYCTGLLVKFFPYHALLKVAIGAMMMVMLDVLIEPIAMKFGMWGWEGRRIPLINYAGWFVVSFLFLLLQANLKAKLRNELAPFVFIILASFFLILNLY